MRVLLEEVEESLSPVLFDRYSFGSLTTLMAMFGTMVGALVGLVIVVLQSIWASRSQPVLRLQGQHALAALRPPLLDDGLLYHYFISHVWSTGQDQARHPAPAQPLNRTDFSLHAAMIHPIVHCNADCGCSHAQARAIKQSLIQSVPGLSVFLDVDDLEDLSLLEDEIDASALIIVFISASYFGSKNCMRELQHAIESGKELIVVREPQMQARLVVAG